MHYNGLMYRSILTTVNEHVNSEVSSRYAIHLAKACGARLYLVFIAPRDLTMPLFKQVEEAMERLFLEARAMDVDVQSIIKEGDVLKDIKDIVRDEAIDITFAAARREDVEKRFFVRTVARGLMLHLPCSVAVIRVVRMGRVHPGNILVPVRGGIGHLRERAYFVAKLAQAFGSKVVAFHSPEPIKSFFKGEMHISPLEWERRLPKDVEDFIECLRRYRVSYDKRIRPGRAGRAISIEASLKRNDLIIMGATARSLLSSILRGNPVEEVMRETRCDLIVLKPRDANPQP